MGTAAAIGVALHVLTATAWHFAPAFRQLGLLPVGATLIGGFTGWNAGSRTSGSLRAKVGAGALSGGVAGALGSLTSAALGVAPLGDLAQAGGSMLVTGALGAALGVVLGGRRTEPAGTGTLAATVALRPGPWLVVAYVALTVAVTWPLATMPFTSLAADFGDAAFITWVITWVARHLTDLLQGAPGAWTAMWTAPIFAPETDTLTYSEHHIGQTLQVLPLYWIAYQPLLAFNTVYVLTFALTGVAAHRLAHYWSGSHLAGAVAGITCAFNEYRLYWSMSHVHALSIHWWLFALWGIDHFVATSSRWALAGATAALVMLHLSSNYLMAFCAPVTAAFAIWTLARHGRLRDVRAWLGLASAGALSVVVVLPLVLRYLGMRESLGFTRPFDEIVANSMSLAAFRIVAPWFGPLMGLALVGALAPSTTGGHLSRVARLGLLGILAIALVLSMGPVLALGSTTWPGPYRVLLDYVPGFDGLRVPNRFMSVALSLASLLAGLGAMWLARWRLGLIVVTIMTVLATRTLVGSFTINRVIPAGVGMVDPPAGLGNPPAYLRPAVEPPAIYRLAAQTSPGAVILELPFGDMAYEVLYTFFTLAHGHRIVNGYSGLHPPSYVRRQGVLRWPLRDADRSWAALAPATHVIVHTSAWTDDTGTRVRGWLESRGATVVGNHDGAWLYAMPAR